MAASAAKTIPVMSIRVPLDSLSLTRAAAKHSRNPRLIHSECSLSQHRMPEEGRMDITTVTSYRFASSRGDLALAPGEKILAGGT